MYVCVLYVRVCVCVSVYAKEKVEIPGDFITYYSYVAHATHVRVHYSYTYEERDKKNTNDKKCACIMHMCHSYIIHNSRLLIIIGLFCKRALQKKRYSAKETNNFNFYSYVWHEPHTHAHLQTLRAHSRTTPAEKASGHLTTHKDMPTHIHTDIKFHFFFCRWKKSKDLISVFICILLGFLKL